MKTTWDSEEHRDFIRREILLRIKKEEKLNLNKVWRTLDENIGSKRILLEVLLNRIDDNVKDECDAPKYIDDTIKATNMQTFIMFDLKEVQLSPEQEKETSKDMYNTAMRLADTSKNFSDACICDRRRI